MKKLLSIFLSIFLLLSFSACNTENPTESDVSSTEQANEIIEKAQKLINEGKIAEAYALLISDKDNQSVKDMLTDFLVVPTNTTAKNYTQYKYVKETVYNEHGDAKKITIDDPVYGEKIEVEYEYVYDANGNILKESKRDIEYDSVEVTEYVYDEHNRPVKIFDQYFTVENVYDENGNVIKKTTTDDEGNVSINEYVFDEQGNELTCSSTLNGEPDGFPNAYTYEYNAKGDITRKCYFLSGNLVDDTSLEYTYDDNGRKTKIVTITAHSTTTEEFTYNETGDVVKNTRKSADYTTEYVYEYTYSSDCAVEVKRENLNSWKNNALTEEYDDHGNLTLRELGDSSEKYEYTYDENGFIIKKTSTVTGMEHLSGYENKTVEYTNDKNGNVLKAVSVKENGIEDITEYTYDSENRILKETRSKGYGDNIEVYHTDEFTYDKYGNILTEYTKRDSTEKSYTYEYTYDEKGNILEKKKNGTPVVKYTYDSNGNRLTVSSFADGDYYLSTERTYDSNGILIKAVKYNPNGGIIAVNELSYDDKGNLVKDILKKGEGDTENTVHEHIYEYTYDEIGNRLTYFESETDLTGHQTSFIEYTYSDYKYFYKK